VELGLFSNPALLAAIGVSAVLQFVIIVLPFAREVFQSAAHGPAEWAVIVLLSLTPVTVIEIGKLVSRRRSREGTSSGQDQDR
jgi:Ca2+-transporting ATPase